MSKVKVIIDENHDSEPAEVWRLNIPGEGERFFQHVLENGQVGDVYKFTALTQKEWKSAVRNGDMMA